MNLADSILSWLLCRRSVLGRDRRETAKRCDGDALDGVSNGVGELNMTNKKFGIIVMDLSLFDFGPKPPCGYIKAKHIRPAYGKGERPVKAHKRITRTREGFRK